MAEEIGTDGRDLLEKIYTSTTHAWLQEIPAIDILRSIWIQQYHASEQGTPWRADQELPPSARLIQSPYDAEARKSQEETDRSVYELVMGRQGKKKGVSSWQGDFSQAKATIEKRGTPADGNE